jgi:hypothetical protein
MFSATLASCMPTTRWSSRKAGISRSMTRRTSSEMAASRSVKAPGHRRDTLASARTVGVHGSECTSG